MFKKAGIMFVIFAFVAAFALNGSLMAAEQGVTEDTVKIGSVGAQSGPFAMIGVPYYQGMNAYFNTVNEEGGVQGREIELITRDDEFDPAQARDYVQELVHDEEVFSLVGQLGTPGITASAEIVGEAGIPSVYFGSGAAELTELGENFFPVQPTYKYEGQIKAYYADEYFEADSIAVLYQTDEVGIDGLEGIEIGLEKMGREDMLGEDAAISYGLDTTDFTSQIQQVIMEDPDLLIIYGLAETASLIVRTAEDFGLDMPMLTTYSNADPSFIDTIQPAEAAPNVIENLHLMGWLEVDDESMQPLMEAMSEYYPDGVITSYTMAGWVAGETFVAGLREVEGDLTWDNYIEAMNQLKFTEGMAKEISYEPGVRDGVTHLAVNRVVEVNGEYEMEQATEFQEFPY